MIISISAMRMLESSDRCECVVVHRFNSENWCKSTMEYGNNCISVHADKTFYFLYVECVCVCYRIKWMKIQSISISFDIRSDDRVCVLCINIRNICGLNRENQNNNGNFIVCHCEIWSVLPVIANIDDIITTIFLTAIFFNLLIVGNAICLLS